MSTLSNTYNFGSSNLDILLQTSLQMCGVLPSEVDGWKAQAALQSLNLILSDLPNRGNNLWLSQSLAMPIIPGQQTYLLPPQVTYIKELQAVKLQNAGNGTIFRNPDYAHPNTGPQYIGIDYGVGAKVSVSYASVTSRVNGEDPFVLPLNLQYSIDFLGWTKETAVWQNAYSSPWSVSDKVYLSNQAYWFVPTAPVAARAWRFFDDSAPATGSTFNDFTASFCNTLNSILLVALSENDFKSIPMPYQALASVSSYYLDRQIQPTISLWPILGSTYDILSYKAATTPMDAGSLINQAQIPQRFLRAIVYELAAELALQFAPDKYPLLKPQAEMMFSRAASEDRERVPLRLTVNLVSYT